jgi:hypothetical protein
VALYRTDAGRSYNFIIMKCNAKSTALADFGSDSFDASGYSSKVKFSLDGMGYQWEYLHFILSSQ